MILQPTLVLLRGSGARRLKEQIARWFSEDERRAFYFAEIEDEDDLAHAIPAAVGELRSAKLLAALIRGGYVPKNYRMQEFRTLIVCLSSEPSEPADQRWIQMARQQVEASLEATPFLNRIFWVVLLEAQKMEDLENSQQKLLHHFGGNESVTLFHILPVWRGSNLEPDETSAILERLAVLLLKADAEASFPIVSEIALNKSAWTIGIEAYRLKGHSEAGKCALFLAARELIAQCFTGKPLSAAMLANLVRQKIPEFDSHADVDPGTPEGMDLVGRYVRNYVPDLLDALATHSSDVESWLDCLKYLKRQTTQPRKEPKRSLRATAMPMLSGKGQPYSGWGILLTAISAAVCPPQAKQLDWQPNLLPALSAPEPVVQQLPRHPIFAAALERVIIDIQPLRYPELLLEAPADPGFESPIPTDSVETARADRELIDAARDLLLQRTFALPSLLSFQFLTGDMAPASAMAQVLSAQDEMERKLETVQISRWIKNVREARRGDNGDGNAANSSWLEFMFSSPIPNPIHTECEMANHQSQPQQPGWFPQFWLHYMHAVGTR